MIFDKHIKDITESVLHFYSDQDMTSQYVQLQKTRKEFQGDWTIVVFPLLRFSKQPLDKTARNLGDFLVHNIQYVNSFNIVKGFLNLEFSDNFWFDVLKFSFSEGFELNKHKDNHNIDTFYKFILIFLKS